METIQGLEQIITETNNRKGYEIIDLVCKRCGEATSIKEGEAEVCSKCKGKEFKQVGRISANKVAEIINRKLQYKCNTCGKVYDQPTQCCNGEYEVNGDKMVWAYYCTGCKRVYSKQIECCAGHEMMEGYYKPASWFRHQMTSHLEIPKLTKEQWANLKINGA